ncbi:hypothetical protein [Rufibacter latericius]|uniref:Uncharacterized protein n=1 Tax=Rufibacter latericius TaxID=2487040 RepID=A0A3M9MPH7_9BACT|nr:hypothetical protein [Rufibacter latericius]RNI26598.1 hypothetical protein EFB08_11305 [Rufibacter latericius]
MTSLQKYSDQLAVFADPQEREAVAKLKKQEQEILLCSLKGTKVNMMTDRQLDTLVASVIGTGLLQLGHKNQLETKTETEIFFNSIAALLREKWGQMTEQEVRLVFKMGVRGDFKADAKEVVFLNEPNINGWFKAYKYQLKAEAHLQKQKLLMEVGRETHPRQMSMEETFELNLRRLEAEMERLSQPGEIYREFDLGNVLLSWLESLGVINLTDAEKLDILNAERKLVLAEKKMESIELTHRLSYKLFQAALETGSHASGNKYEQEAKNRARKEVFKGFVLSTVESGEDIRTLVMEQVETNQKERARLSSLDEIGMQQQVEYYLKTGNRHGLALIKEVSMQRQSA